MPEVQIRSAVAGDLSALMAIDHSCQMDVQHEEGLMGAIFREIRLPRTVPVLYPRPVSGLSESWNRRSGVLVAVLGKQIAGYARATDSILAHTTWLLDVVVSPRFRRQGIASTLILAAQSWGVDRKNHRAVLEMQSKNNPAVHLAQKLGYEFCGYNDQYYETQDIALFFGRSIR